MQWIFWLLALLIAYAYFLYPLALRLALAVRPPRQVLRSGDHAPSISIIVPAYNEAANIARRIEEFLSLIDASGLQGELIVVSDGSTDATAAIASSYASTRVRTLALPTNAGKACALNAGASAARHDVLILADARQRWSADTLRLLAENFHDPRVGAASGQLVLEASDGVVAGVGLYWRFEKWLRQCESRLHSAVGVSGSICTVRRSLFPVIPPGTILDDVYWPLVVVMRGYRVLFDERALAHDRLPSKAEDEFRRKVRTLAGNYQLVARLPAALLPWRNPIWLQFISHKLLRLLVPWALIGMLACSVILGGPLYYTCLAAQLALYALGLYGLFRGVHCRLRLASTASTFLLLNSAAWLAFWIWLTGRTHRSWKKVVYVTADASPVPNQIVERRGAAS